MEVLTKATVALTLLPVIGGSIALATTAPVLAQTILPTDTTTQVSVSDQDVIDISGGTQAAGNIFHSFDQFSLGQQQTANFITALTTDTVIGQVIGGTTSTIDGLLKITGSSADLYLVNPAGLIFGPNARLDLGGSFTATTATHLGNDTQWFEVLSDPDYSTLVTAPSHFGFSHSGGITNHGQLTVRDGHSLRLLAPQVTNAGMLSAPGGEVTLFAPEPGQTIHIGQSGGLLNLEISPDNRSLDNLPASITGGEVNHSNTLVVSQDGAVSLVTEPSPRAQPSFSLINRGIVSTQGTTGGEINLLGDTIQVMDSGLNATGKNGGGSIRIGGAYQGSGSLPRSTQTTITNTTLITDADQQGNGGQVIVWSDGITNFDGTVSAQSTTGDGGLVETSGLLQLTIGENTEVTTTAPTGRAGLWLLDPTELTIVDTNAPGEIITDTNDPVNNAINVSTIVSALNNTNVTLQAASDITFAAALDARANGTANDLFLDTATLNLNERITLKEGGQLSGTATTVNVGANGRIQNGVDAVASGGTVNLAANTYRDGNVIIIDQPLSLVGQGRDLTAISGDIDSNGVGDHPVLKITNWGSNSTLTGLTLQDGLSTSNGAGLSNNGNNIVLNNTHFINNEIIESTKDGGAIHNTGSLTILNSVFENNRTSSDGGAIDILQGSVEIVDSVFLNNQAAGHGGAIDIDPQGVLTVLKTDFSQNTAASHGGAIYSEGDVQLEAVNFTQNLAIEGSGGAAFLTNTSEIRAGYFFNNRAQSGGGLYNQGESQLLSSIFSNNQSTGIGTFDGGGGIENAAGGRLSLESSLISNNLSATNGGGVLNLANDSQTGVAIANSAIVNNQAANKGGGIEIASIESFSDLSQLTVSNSTISGNQADIGGGIRTVGPTTLTNVTITANTAIRSGGGLSKNPSTAATPDLINTIVANNIAPSHPDVEGQFSDQGNNLIGIDQGSIGFNVSTLVGTTNTPIDPRLTSLNNTRGSLPSHQLLSDSPAANAGNNLAAAPSDQHRQPRIVGNTVDIGAVESPILPAVPPPTNPTSPTPTPQFSDPSSPSTPSSPDNPPQLAPPQPTTQLDEANVDEANVDEANVLVQEEKITQPLNLEPEQISPTTPSRRLRYFDEAAFQYLEDSFSEDYEDYWQLPQTQSITLQTVQKTLQQANELHQIQSAVIYAIFVPQAPGSSTKSTIDRFALPRNHSTPSPEDKLLLVLVSATGKPVQYLVNVTRAELTQQAKLFRLATSDPDDQLSYQALARQMYSWLLAPLQADLAQGKIEHIMYSLDQGLRTIPLAAMMHEDSFVIEQYGISIIPSMGLTQPQFDTIPSVSRSLVAGANQFEALAALPAVPIELKVVAENTQATDILLNETFTLDNFLTLHTSQQPDLLHLATHAEFNAGNLDESFIQFWDAQLTFNQMRELNWSELRLLILSACGTALSSPEAELGFIGLAAAAGIETSMGSLWNVSDLGTLALMTEFYTQLSPTSLRFKSLQQAQISLIQGNTHINNSILDTSSEDILLPAEWNLPASAEFSHPFYWAGFTMVGNPWR
ncbi:CHAT domain-containing protein [Leptolyngbya cf. ectocarpi LEGE 11479]|uniref:CHAT domain-containing protein n=1 Tax=Leptolyngbya cf. ectocarpi LEGE 11479 TaxID=1828722 RepID=A0A928ZTX2_LEPEC|nr:CHAT domain-containing protein [Leptolyngbya ectocarpi]MBE9067383.1 CHAT domain-containing protein [Leptolyngbya cf. ectocarpi LEGE 11479]